MKTDSYKPSGSPSLMLATGFLVLAGTLTTIAVKPANTRALEDLVNVRKIKVALDGFAMDNDGVYPSKEAAQFYEIPHDPRHCNGLLIQLIASGNTNDEKMFWVDGAKVCNVEEPDGITTDGGRFDPAECLQAGDCGWAYVREHTNTDNPSRPILFDAFLPGTKKFDGGFHEGKVTTLFIDGSAQTLGSNAKGQLIHRGEDLLSPNNEIWKNSKDPAKLLSQPKPSKAAQKAIAEAKENTEAEAGEAVNDKE